MKRTFPVVAAMLMLLFVFVSVASASGNKSNDSFSKAKKHLVLVYADQRITGYCGALYDEYGTLTLPVGFITPRYKNRANRVEWEHIVPAEHFGRAFAEWRDGNQLCVSKQGNPFKGRRCAEKVNQEYRYMQADMYNLVPAIGAVNALRRNYDFTILSGEEDTFGSCAMKIKKSKAEPPEQLR